MPTWIQGVKQLLAALLFSCFACGVWAVTSVTYSSVYATCTHPYYGGITITKGTTCSYSGTTMTCSNWTNYNGLAGGNCGGVYTSSTTATESISLGNAIPTDISFPFSCGDQYPFTNPAAYVGLTSDKGYMCWRWYPSSLSVGPYTPNSDGDKTPDIADNCPTVNNPLQTDSDGDGIGDLCEGSDSDGDNIYDQYDNCPGITNVNQLDSDGDGYGDLCDAMPFPGPGGLDISFNPNANNTVSTIVQQADGKLLIGGYFSTLGGSAKYYIARMNANGSNGGFSAVANSVVNSIAVQADGKIIIVGAFTNVNNTAKYHTARLNADGSLDNSFNASVDANVYSVALQADGKIIIGGGFTTVNGIPRNKIARLNSDGSLDSSFNASSGGSVQSIFIQTDGKILVGGNFTNINGAAIYRIARLNADGTLDGSFSGGVNSSYVGGVVQTIFVQVDGRILIGGDFTTYSGTPISYLARLNIDGSLDSSFNLGTGVNNRIYAIAVQPDGKILIGGSFTAVNGSLNNNIARLNADGSLDAVFNSGAGVGPNNGPLLYVYSIALQADGKIVIGGDFTSYNGITRNRIARIVGQSDSDGDGLADDVDFDDDNDLIPDTWETIYGFNPLVNDANGDADSDGLTNRQEYNNGSNPNAAPTKNDYNSDGIASWIWKGQSNGHETESQIWQLTLPLQSPNFTAPARSYPPIFADQANWEIVTTGDFNKDGDADILWRSNSTDDWKIWQMQDGTRAAQTNWNDAFDPGHEWTVVGAGDSDKDGDDDIILNKVSTGEVMIWEMQNYVVAATHTVGSKAGYTLNRIGDFNKDGDVDLLFRENGSDLLVTWEIEQNALVQERSLNNTGAGYNPVCAGDFDNDGDDDIMFVNSTTQQEKWFVMENYTRSQRVGSINTGFVFLGCGDYDGDGDADSLWQRSSDDKIRAVLQQDYGIGKQTVFTNAFGGTNGFVYRGNRN